MEQRSVSPQIFQFLHALISLFSSVSQSLYIQLYIFVWLFPLKLYLPSSITSFRNKLMQLEEESGDSSPLDCKDDKSLSTLWLENTIKWTGVGSLQRKLAGLRCEYPRSWTNKNQSFPSPGEMALGGKVCFDISVLWIKCLWFLPNQ